MDKPLTLTLAYQTGPAGKTDRTAPRDGNEDAVLVIAAIGSTANPQPGHTFNPGPLGTLLVVADGMGGMNAGEVASEIAINTVQQAFAPGNISPDDASVPATRAKILQHTIATAHQNVRTQADLNPSQKGMGSTIIMAWVVGNQLTLAWCGDSRCYLYNPAGGIQPLSTDHSYVQTLVNTGQITYEESFGHPQGNIITTSLGDPVAPAKAQIRNFTLADGDTLLLCSDGLSGVLRDQPVLSPQGRILPGDTLQDILERYPDSPELAQQHLWAAAQKAGWYDNVTTILLHVVAGAGKQPRAKAPTPQLPNRLENTPGANPVKTPRGNMKMWILALGCLIATALVVYFALHGNNAEPTDTPDHGTQTTGATTETTEPVRAVGQEINDPASVPSRPQSDRSPRRTAQQPPETQVEAPPQKSTSLNQGTQDPKVENAPDSKLDIDKDKTAPRADRPEGSTPTQQQNNASTK